MIGKTEKIWRKSETIALLVIIALMNGVLIEGLYLWFAGLTWAAIAYTTSIGFGLWLVLGRWLLSRNKMPTILALLTAAHLICLMFAAQYGVLAEANTVGFLVETDFSEAKEFIGASSFLWIAGVILTSIVVGLSAAALRREKWVLAPKSIFHLTPGLLVLMAAGMKFDRTAANPDTLHFPLAIEVPVALAIYGKEKLTVYWELANRPDFSEITASSDDEVEAVLIIGESARGSNFGLNGYARDTTPRLANRHLVSYRNVVSCEASTRKSVPCLITRASMTDPMRAASEVSIINLFKAGGYSTSWFSSHLVVGKNDTLITALANEADSQVFSSSYYGAKRDEYMIPLLHDYFREPAQKRFTVLHTIGSHWQYSQRYSKIFENFVPICENERPNSCDKEALRNSYDNSILSTDDFIDQAIGMLSQKTSIIIYTSDHGESLGEDGNFAHGKPDRPEQRDVPLIFWASDQYKQKHPERYAAAKRHEHLPLNHDYIFHSMLDCAGIESSVINKKLSLCAPPAQSQAFGGEAAIPVSSPH